MQHTHKIRYSMIVTLIILLSTASFTLPQVVQYQLSGETSEVEMTTDISIHDRSLVSDDPIVVTSNGDFGLPTWSGSGLLLDPWIIDGLTINMSGISGSCIEIRNTCDFFVIQNCILIGGTSGFGIILSNVTNGIIQNNTIENHSEYAIHLSWSQSNNVTLNRCENNYGGIEILSSSSGNVLNNNTLRNNEYRGIYLAPSSSNNDFEWNSFISNTFNAIDDSITASNFIQSNYWSDYSGVDETPRDAIGDTSYSIAGEADNSDPYPQMIPPTTPPIYWHESPGELVVQWGTDFVCGLNATAFAGISTWWINDTGHFSIDSSGLLRNASYLPEGATYGLQVLVTDTYNNVLEGLFGIRVLDTTPPEWIEEPVSQILEFGDEFYYDLNATDPSGLHIWTITDISNFNISVDGKITNLTNLPVDIYPLQVSVNDTYGYTLTSSFTLTVQDTTPPDWVEGLMNQTIEFGDEVMYNLNATDLSDIDEWWLVGSAFFSIDSDGLLMNTSFVPVGIYDLQVFVNDTQSQLRSGQITITIQDTTSPIWTILPPDQILECGQTLDFQLEAWDLSELHQWTLNDTTSFVVTSIGRVINLDIVAPGIYSLRVTVYDPYDNTISANFSITVEDTQPPEWIISLDDQIVEIGSSFEFQLSANDPTGLDIWWLTDDSHFTIDSTGLIVNGTALAIGTYEIEVSVNDSYGHTLTGAFDVIVEDTTAPYWIIEPVTQYLVYGDVLGYHLNAVDLSGITTWSINNTILFSITSTGTIISIDTLDPGVYHILVTASDAYENTLSETITIVVESPPSIPLSQILIFGLGGVGGISLLITIIYLRKRSMRS